MADKSIDLLFVELSVVKRDMEESLAVHHRLFNDDNFKTDRKEVKVHLMKLKSISRAIASLQTSINHHYAMAEIKLACLSAREDYLAACHGQSGE